MAVGGNHLERLTINPRLHVPFPAPVIEPEGAAFRGGPEIMAAVIVERRAGMRHAIEIDPVHRLAGHFGKYPSA